MQKSFSVSFVLVLSLFLSCGARGVRAKSTKGSKVVPLRLEKGVFVTSCGGPLKEVDDPLFSVEDECVEAWVRFEHLSARHTLRFFYYDPEGKQYMATEEDWSFQPQSQARPYHRYALIRHKFQIQGEQAAILPGQWKVVLWLDGSYLAEGRFRLQKKTAPLEENLQQATKLYFDLQFEEAVERLWMVLGSTTDPRLWTEAYWWLALCQNSLGQREELRQTLLKLLEAEPGYAVSPSEAREAGAEEVRSLLDELRREIHPDVFKQTSYPPGLELSEPEEAPILGKKWPLWKKLLIFGGIPVVVGTGVFLLARGGGKATTESCPLPDQHFDLVSIERTPNCAGANHPEGTTTHEFQVDPNICDVSNLHLSVILQGDYDEDDVEFATIALDGEELEDLVEGATDYCRANDPDPVVVSDTLFVEKASDGTIEVKVIPSPGVISNCVRTQGIDCRPLRRHVVQLEFDYSLEQ